MTRDEALALVRGHLEVALAAERRPCATCCLAIFPRLHRDGADLWRPGLVWSQAMRSWTDAIDAWEAAGSPAEGKAGEVGGKEPEDDEEEEPASKKPEKEEVA